MTDENALTFWEYFRDLFVPENRLELPLKEQHRKICAVLEDAFLGLLPPEIQFVLVHMPPRTGKTKLAEALVTWATAYFPDSQWIMTGYSGDVAEKSLAYIAKTLREPWYVGVFGDYLHAKRADHVTTIAGGNIYAEGVNGSLTGKGAGLKREAGGAIIIDDPAKPDEVFSQVLAEAVRRWFETTLKNRRNSDRGVPIILIAQRLGIGDLADYLAKTYPANCLILEFPALVDSATGAASEADGAVSAFPETVSTETLKAYKATRTGRFVLASQYQQQPVALGGNLIQTDSFHRFDVFAPAKWERLVITVDTALKAKQASNHSVLQLWGKLGPNAYLLDSARGKWESPELLATTIAFYNKHAGNPERPRPELIVEEKAAGPGLVQQLRRLGIPVRGIERDIDKVRRVQAVMPYIDSGFVFVPRDDQVPWLSAFLTECAAFAADGTSVDDDQVDCLVDGIEQLLGRITSILDVLLKKQTDPNAGAAAAAPAGEPGTPVPLPVSRSVLDATGRIKPMQA